MTNAPNQPQDETPIGEAPAPAEAAPAKADVGLLRDARILVVEDTKAVRAAAVKLLSDAGAVVDEAEEGETALAILRTAAFNDMPHHLVITDLKMPKMDGLRLLETIRMDTGLRTLPVVVLSAASDEALIMACARRGISTYLPKPTKPSQLRQAAAEALACSARSRGIDPSHASELRALVLDAATQSGATDPAQNPVARAVLDWIEHHQQPDNNLAAA